MPEAKKDALVEEIEDDNEGPPRPMGAVVMLSFETYAVNMRNLYEIIKEYNGRGVVVQ